MGALDGLLVVSLEQAVAAPLCTLRLAEAGARVIKIERAEGDFARGYDRVVHGESAYFVWLNRGKQSLVLDIKQADDAALLARIVGRADVFVQNLAPGAAARAGFGSAELRARHPRLITADISGYGEDGPAAARKAYDLLVQCETGLAAITGGPDEAGRVGVSVADIACGMNAHAAILEALIARGRAGKGSGIAVSLFDSIAEWMTVPLLHHDYGGRAPPRAGLHHATIAPYGVYACGDGRQVVLSVQNEREWRAFCADVLVRPDLAADARFADNSARCTNRTALDTEIAAAFGALDTTGAIARLTIAGIAFAPLNEVADLSRHAHLRRVEADTASGPVALPASPVRWEDAVRPIGAVSGIGEHNDVIRREFD
ncbi:MAG: CoA transferase [Sphingomonas sp.]|uniref:CaiB/BaiF CoA transferase family protein n=1 Tax=Sphingomonas sp. TaxID=28214 RepID=UPI0012017FF3|nr:CaiB/BaiF CoA-transferase family protein [Sphingomonas sp.]THD35881.1 MAG: CoA transferase [Sphingomonas sp.]